MTVYSLLSTVIQQNLLEVSLPHSLLLNIWNKRRFIRIAITHGYIVHAHAENFMRDAVFVVEVRFQHFGVVGVDGHFHAEVE